jgi:hypothetical protein
MARHPAASELSAQTRPSYTVAAPGDEARLRRLLRENPMGGAIRLTFEREPDYFAGANLAGGEDQTILVSEADRAVCLGRCTRRECWVNGRPRDVGYLAELRLDARAQGRFALLRDGYRFFEEQQRADPAAVYFTSISADNERARRLLERGVRGLPTYRFLDELTTLLIAVPRRPKAARLRVEAATPEHLAEIVGVLNATGQRRQFAAVWTVDRLCSLAAHGLPLDRFLVAMDGSKVVACGALWDQRPFRQTVIRGYAPGLAVVRPLINLAGLVFGTPRLPAPDSTLAHALLSLLALAEGSEGLLPDFVEACFPLAARLGVEFLTLGVLSKDARLGGLRRRFRTRAWPSQLYRVDFPDQPVLGLEAGGCQPDLALL